MGSPGNGRHVSRPAASPTRSNVYGHSQCVSPMAVRCGGPLPRPLPPPLPLGNARDVITNVRTPLARCDGDARTCLATAPPQRAGEQDGSASTSVREPRLLAAMTPTEELRDENAEYSQPSSDLAGLLAYLAGLKSDGARFTELTYIVNDFKYWGMPLKHHGFVLKSECLGKPFDEYLTLDFSRRGILWDTFEEYPNVPNGTILEQTYTINVPPVVLRSYCENTQPFSWPRNDCSAWSRGLIRAMGIKDSPVEDDLPQRMLRGDPLQVVSGRGGCCFR